MTRLLRKIALSTTVGRLRSGLFAALPYLPGIACGVFLARLLGEQIGLPGVWAAVAISVVFGAAGGWLSSRLPFERTWPGLVLFAYIFYPEPYPALALQVVAIAVLCAAMNSIGTRSNEVPGDSRLELPGAVLVGLGGFFLYCSTLAPGVLPADSGELQVVAAQLGVAHPPGFPLYILIAHIFTRMLPFVPPAYAVNLLSAVTSALTLSFVYLSGFYLTRRHWPGLLAAVALGTATTFWSQATTANVRSLTGLFTILIIYVLIKFRQAVNQINRPAADRWLIATALFMGFGLTHHVSLLFLIVIGLLFVLVVDPSILRSPHRWKWPIIAGLAGLLPLLYLPLRAAADVRGASPDLATWSGFLEHALATGFRGDLFYFLAPADLLQRMRIIGNIMGFQFAPLVLAGMGLGLVLIIRRDKPAALLLGGTFGVYVFVAATYRAPQTVEYLIPAYIVAALILVYALSWLLEALNRYGRIASAVAVLALALLIVGVLGQFGDHLSASGARHEGEDAHDFAAQLLAEAPADSVILAHWHWATPLWYLQEVEGMRTDVEVRFVFPEGESYDATWERRTREALADGRAVITTWISPSPPVDWPIPEPLGEALVYRQEPRTTLPLDFLQANFFVDNLVEVLGYRIEKPKESAALLDEELVVTVAWRPIGDLPPGATTFIHYLSDDGTIYGQDDRPAVAAEGITLTQFRVTPRPGAPPETSQLYFGAAGGGSSGREFLTEVDIMRASSPPFTRNKVRRQLIDEKGDVLIGYDWDHSLPDRQRLYLHWLSRSGGFYTQTIDDAAVDSINLLPYRGPWGVPVERWEFPRDRDSGHYVPLGQGIVWTGETLNGLELSPDESVVVDQEFHSSRPLNRDYVVSVRLIGLEPDGVHWAWWNLQDWVPAMGAIPTLKWITGSFVRSPHRVTVAESATIGQALTGATTLYDAFTNRPLPILDERIVNENPWIPLCRAIVVE